MNNLFRWKDLFVVFLISLLWALSAQAHDRHQKDEQELEALFSVYEQIATLAPLTQDHQGITSTPVVQIGHDKIYLNSAFWQLTGSWVRLYYQLLQNECDGCIKIDESAFLEMAEDHMAQSFFKRHFGHPLRKNAHHISIGAADIGARLGKEALVAKVTSEVAETVLSKVVGGGGVHLACNLIDALIIFGTRHIQAAFRSWSWSGAFDASGTKRLIHLGWARSRMRKIQDRVQFVGLGPVEINEEQILELDQEGPNRFWGWVDQGKRARWLNQIVRGLERGQSEDKLTQLRRKDYLGQRMKRYLFLKRRRRGNSHFLAAHGSMDKHLNKNLIWILAVQESVLHRGLKAPLSPTSEIPAGTEPARAISPAEEDIIQEIASDILPDQAPQLKPLLKDIEIIFDPNIPTRVRLFHVDAMESLWVGVIYGIFTDVLSAQSSHYGTHWGALLKKVKLHYRAGQFASYVHELSDYMRLAALESNSEDLWIQKYSAMESLARVFRYLHQTEPLLRVQTAEELSTWELNLHEELLNLKTFTPWKEKPIPGFHWPFFKKAPRCEDLALRVQR